MKATNVFSETDDVLQHLYLAGNQLSSLPDPLAACLPSLTYLDLRDNMLDAVPAVLVRLRRLELLLLQDNRIAALPVHLGESAVGNVPAGRVMYHLDDRALSQWCIARLWNTRTLLLFGSGAV